LSKSHPLFQAFRTWKFLQNLKIYRREDNVDGKLIIDNDVTAEYITDVAELYDKVSGMKEIKQNQLLKLFRLSDKQYRWNYVEDKTYPLNETRYEINSRLAKIGAGFFLSEESEETLWHILYSINNREELHAALRTFAVKLERTSLAKDFFGGKTDDEKVVFADSFADTFCKMKQFESSYASYSRKAIRRMLSLMMSGSHWSEDDIDAKTKANIEKILNHDFTAPLDRLPEKVIAELGSKHCMADFQGLPEYLACYVIYGRYSEATDMSIFESVEDVDRYLKFEFRKTNLRNPVVQGVLEEATKVVRDIWAQYGKPDEIHIEMGRELKLPNDKRAAVTQRALDNEHTNLRIKKLLMEFAKPEYDIDSVRPYSPMQQDILKIYESTVLQEQAKTIPDDVKSVVDNLGNPSKKVTSSEIMRYKLWLEQKYRSPYTGEPIQLSRLFTPEYEIEHVIPRSRFFDDSFNNKVICEAAVNKEKSNMLGMEFINKCHGQLVRCGAKTVRIFSVDQYQTFVKEHYSGNKSKQEHLLADDIPDKFISRQLNDTRYISRYALELFSKFVREEGEEEATSKHVVSMVGSITDRLKKEWGINDVWNELVAPRFERMNRLLNTNAFGAWRSENGKQFFQTNIPVEYAQGFSKKRIDHRHHAMDAIVIACATHKHINYFNNENAKSKQFRHDLRNALCTKSAVDDKGNYVWTFNKPWDSFTQDVRNVLQGIIVSFKQNLRIINTTSNYYCHYVNGKKVMDRQEKGDNIAIRKSMHKATVFGKVFLRETKAVKLADALDNVSAITDKAKRKVILDVIASYHNHADKKTLVRYFKDREYKVNGMDFKKVEISFIPKESDKYAVRVRLSDSLFAKRSDIEKNLTDDSIKRILYRHLDKYMVDGEDNIKEALSPNGIEDMNRNIKELNGGIDHKPIYSVRKFEQSDAKFPIGFVGSKDKKFVEAEKGTNLFFAIYKDENGDRNFMTIALHEAIERQKQQLPIAKQEYDDAKHHYTLLFILSPNDLVYVPQSVDEHVAIDNINGAGQIYKMVSSNKAECYFVSSTFASPILNKVEVSPLNKSEKPWHSVPLRNYGELRDGAIEIAASDMYNTAIKKTCYKLSVDRLGHIKNIIG
jgi:CRISPR-associated endonuclease Csn1